MFAPADPPPADRPLRRRLLFVATAVGALLAVALAVGGVLWVIHDLHRDTGAEAKVLRGYVHRVRACSDDDPCIARVYARCVADPFWHDHAHASKVCPGGSVVRRTTEP